jgi:hypothetical protein
MARSCFCIVDIVQKAQDRVPAEMAADGDLVGL